MKTYGDYLNSIFPGLKIQKISIDAGFTCPNRDGNISTGGCIYCRNDSFSPKYCDPKDSVKTQLEKGKLFFRKKYPEMKFLAFFQSFTGTYNRSVQYLESLYKEALEDEDVAGIVIATRPDCVSNEVLALLKRINDIKPVFIELGAETSHGLTLKVINRNHTWAQVEEAVKRIAGCSLHVGLHLIAGLPGEDETMILKTIERSCSLPIETLKLHQLQVLKGTILHEKILRKELEVPQYSLNEYLDLCAKIVKLVPEKIIIERFLSQSPPELVITPSWGLKNYEFMAKLAQLLNH